MDHVEKRLIVKESAQLVRWDTITPVIQPVVVDCWLSVSIFAHSCHQLIVLYLDRPDRICPLWLSHSKEGMTFNRFTSQLFPHLLIHALCINDDLAEGVEGDLGSHGVWEEVFDGRDETQVRILSEWNWSVESSIILKVQTFKAKHYCFSDIMEVARAGIAFYEHQRGIEVTLLFHCLHALTGNSCNIWIYQN